jgi:hypothetical protein
VLRSAGLSPRNFAGRDLVAKVKAKRRKDGSISGFVSYTAFGVLALRASGQTGVSAQASYLVRAQASDGGFGIATSAASDPDMTGAVLQALAARGGAAGPVQQRAIDYLRGNQNSDGGFGQLGGRSSNAQSTAYAIQGLIAARAPAPMTDRGIGYLRGLQRADGSVRYSRDSAQTPVWVTAQALAALRRKPLPLAAVPRKKRKHKAHKSGAAPAKASAASGHDQPEAKKSSAKQESRAPATSMVPFHRAEPRPVEQGDAGRRPVSATADRGGSSSVPAWLVACAVAAVLAPLVFRRRRLRRSAT